MVEKPLVIEQAGLEGTTWLLSFGGPNPETDECIELTKEQCFWIVNKIMNIGVDGMSIQARMDIEKFHRGDRS